LAVVAVLVLGACSAETDSQVPVTVPVDNSPLQPISKQSNISQPVSAGQVAALAQDRGLAAYFRPRSWSSDVRADLLDVGAEMQIAYLGPRAIALFAPDQLVFDFLLVSRRANSNFAQRVVSSGKEQVLSGFSAYIPEGKNVQRIYLLSDDSRYAGLLVMGLTPEGDEPDLEQITADLELATPNSQ